MATNDAKVTPEAVLQALGTVQEPELHDDLVSLNMIRNVEIEGGDVSFTLVLTTMACPMKAKMQDDAKAALMTIPGVTGVTVNLIAETPAHARPATGKQVGDIVLQDLLPTVKNAVAIASGKGGVGKSTVAVNIAVALAKEGSKVGLLDADIYGPSIPTMFDLNESPDVTQDEKIIPLRKYGVEIMSIGFMIPPDKGVIWRGPLVAKMIQQFLDGVEWGELDYLIIDLPPGTGDTQLTLTQNVPLAGGLIVSTPQAVALADVVRAVSMFQKVGVPILGVMENMSTFICPKCGHEEQIFDHGGAETEADNLGVTFLGSIPIDVTIRKGGDSGVPVVESHPDSAIAKAFTDLARAMAAKISVQNLGACKDERHEELGGKGLPMA
jgi:ATP-binding protein involved in chromosome partitioning